MSNPSDDPVIQALLAAIAVADSVALRCALADIYLRTSEFYLALEQFEAALRLTPADAALMTRAAGAARAADDDAKATAYELASAALSGGVAVNAQPASDAESARVQAPENVRPLRAVPTPVEAPEPAWKFAGVGGMEDVKEALDRNFIRPVRNPELYRRFGKSISGGLILYGPPGCGKTTIARALAGEIGARLITVGLDDVLDMWHGGSEKKLHELFENARRSAPALVFFDEFDALGQKRSQLRGAAGRTLTNQLLDELDGVGRDNTGLYFLAATNHPWDVDSALRRPGRFDKLVFVPPPNEAARVQILRKHLSNHPCASDLDLNKIAHAAEGLSGADVFALVEAATLEAIDVAFRGGKQDGHITQAILEKIQPSIKPSTGAWLELAKNYVLFSNDAGAYDDLAAYLRGRKAI